MTIKVSKPAINIREELADLKQDTGLKGQELMRADTAQEARTAISAGRKNMIINGAMNVAQRGTSFAAVDDDEYTLDRFWYNMNGINSVYTVTQDSDAPDGFASSLKLDVTTADTTIGAGNWSMLNYTFEGQDVQHLKKGTASAESVTVSFWVKSNITGTYAVLLWDAPNSRQNTKSYTINAADTWEYKTITYAGDTTGTIDNDNTDGLQLRFILTIGSTYTGGSEGISAHSGNATSHAANHAVNLASSTSNYLNITGVQLELGSVATEFEHRSYGEELALCQRYFERVRLADRYQGKLHTTTQAHFTYNYRVKKRATPSLSGGICTNIFDGTSYNGSYSSKDHDGISAESVTYRIIAASSMGTPIYRNLAGYGLGFDLDAEIPIE
jgi:hypothetical protein